MERVYPPIQLDERNFGCPFCRAPIRRTAEKLFCVSVSSHGPFFVDSAGRFNFLPQDTLSYFIEEHQSGVNRLKSFFKRYPKLYYPLWYVFCPVFLSGKRPGHVAKLLPESALILNIGSGPRRIHPAAINVDIVPFTDVDVVADAAKLPFPDGSVDAVLSESLLEHVSNPADVAREMARVLKPGGIVYASVPFLTPFHASPDDYTRWTRSGLRTLFPDFEAIEEGVDAGPWSALLVFLAYSLGTIFSFGSKRLAPFLGLFFMLILGPLKIFDFIFVRIPGAEAVAAQLYFIGRKTKQKSKS